MEPTGRREARATAGAMVGPRPELTQSGNHDNALAARGA
jgi:hypothetical protein